MRIPYISTPDKPLSATTQSLVPVADIKDGLIIYKSGGAALIMESTSLNFGLLSEREQQAVIASYAALLNSLGFPIQISVRSQKKDISKYLKNLDEAQKKITNPKLTNIMNGYKNFILESVKKKNVLSKRFFVIIPFTPYELGVAKSIRATLLKRNKEEALPYAESYVVRKARIALLPKRDHLTRQVGRLGVFLQQLTDNELINLFYNSYNPEPPIKEKEVFA